MFSYTVEKNASKQTFEMVCRLIESHFTGIVKEKLLEDGTLMRALAAAADCRGGRTRKNLTPEETAVLRFLERRARAGRRRIRSKRELHLALTQSTGREPARAP